MLEERYQQLREVSETQNTLWEAEKKDLQQQLSSQAEALQQACAARDALASLTQTLQTDLYQVQQDHAALIAHHSNAAQQLEQLQQQLATMAEALHQAQSLPDEQTTQLQTLNLELATLRQEQDVLIFQRDTAQAEMSRLRQQLSSQTERLQRLRQLIPLPVSLQR